MTHYEAVYLDENGRPSAVLPVVDFRSGIAQVSDGQGRIVRADEYEELGRFGHVRPVGHTS